MPMIMVNDIRMHYEITGKGDPILLIAGFSTDITHYSKIIKELSKSSQFIVVSHNDSLITEADIAIGVSKQNDESKAFGLQLSELRQQALAKTN